LNLNLSLLYWFICYLTIAISCFYSQGIAAVFLQGNEKYPWNIPKSFWFWFTLLLRNWPWYILFISKFCDLLLLVWSCYLFAVRALVEGQKSLRELLTNLKHVLGDILRTQFSLKQSAQRSTVQNAVNSTLEVTAVTFFFLSHTSFWVKG
jgi:hypothetical protein